MYGIVCDACNRPLLVDSPVRYVTKVEVYAAYDPLEITEEDLQAADRESWRQLIEAVEQADPKELEAQVHQTFRFDLCPECRARYVRDPLAPARPGHAGEKASDDGGQE